jgi:Ca-activated chloride channel homolog
MTAFVEHFHFLRPGWLVLLAVLALLPWAWRRAAAQVDPWRRAVDPHLLPALLEPAAPATRGNAALALSLAALAVASLALAGPAWRQVPQPLLRSDAGLVVALDLSDRMRAADLAPDRLHRARFKLIDLLRERADGQVGLVAYAGDAFTVAPLTSDTATLQSFLSALEPDLMPLPGQRADRAIELGMQLARDAGVARVEILLLTDAADPRAIDAAQRARDGGARVSVLGIGTEQGAPIPLPGGSFASDGGGRPLLAALQRDALERLARAGGGRFEAISVDDGDLRRLGVLDVDTTVMLEDDQGGAIAQYRDEGIWLVLLLLPLAALGFRRGWLGCLPLLFLLPPPTAHAQAFDALWQREDQRAHRALVQGDHERARALAVDPAVRGAAAFREGDFDDAAQAFAEGDSATDHYNRGNALARSGKLQDALTAYDEALARDANHEDAQFNRGLVEQALQQQQQQQQKKSPGDGSGEPAEQDDAGDPSGDAGEEPPEGEGEGSSGDRDDPAQAPGESGAEGEDPEHADGADGDSEDAPGEDTAEQQRALADAIDEALQEGEEGEAPVAVEHDPAADETAQAAEQMLRRIPDDPGGLLRRKFALEHRRRTSQGQGEE